MRQNVYITTSGSFDQAALRCTIAQLGIDNVMFSVDDPFSDNFEAVDFLSKTNLSKEDKEKFAHANAERLLKLSSDTYSHSAVQSSMSDVKSAIFTFKAKVKSKMARKILSFLVKY